MKLTKSGVFLATDESRQTDYSDGDSAEQAIINILGDVSDLSSTSEELAARIVDWPSEYHLSSLRSNLIRPFDLSSTKNVLELGNGCGAISRFLVEHEHLQIDAVEGSQRRANIAAMRCADKKNIQFHCANFNDLLFVKSHYDLILLIGVTEYAGKYSKKRSDEEALQDVLALVKSALSPKGIALIGIENRLGLKYILGACEDHYAEPFVGVQNYPESNGIRTYTKPEWERQIDAAGFTAQQFMLPFPDYKVPTLIVGNQEGCFNSAIEDLKKDSANLQANAVLNEGLSKVRSRDYCREFNLEEKEAKLWRALLAENLLEYFSNSYLIALSNCKDSLASFCDFSVFDYGAKTQNSQINKPEDSKLHFDEEIEEEMALIRAHAANMNVNRT